MTSKTKRRMLKVSGLAIDVTAPLITTLTQFPLWVEKSTAATISGLFLVFALLSIIPLFKWLREKFSSPSIKLAWTVIFFVIYALRSIIDQMLIISCVGMISAYIGDIVYSLGDKYENEVK